MADKFLDLLVMIGLKVIYLNFHTKTLTLNAYFHLPLVGLIYPLSYNNIKNTVNLFTTVTTTVGLFYIVKLVGIVNNRVKVNGDGAQAKINEKYLE